jgi:type III secretion system YscQ/HrcQ family protein
VTETARPYPVGRLPRLSPTEARLLEVLSRDLPAWEELSAGLARALGDSLERGVTSLGAVAPSEAVEGLTVGWMGALEDAAGEPVGVLHVEAPLVQALAGRVLAGRAASPEVRPLLPVEEECVAALLVLVLGDAGLPLRARTADVRALGGLDAERLGRAVQHFRVDGVSGWATLWLVPERWPRRLAAHRSRRWLERLQGSPLAAGVRIELHVRLATFRESARALLELEPGDLLLPGAWRGLPGPPTRGRLCLSGRPVADVAVSWGELIELRVLDGPCDEEGEVSDSEASTRRTLKMMRPIVDERLEELEIVVGSASLTLGEILELEPGRVFSLGVPAASPVELVLDGRTIGRGELVEVGGRLGVRITSIAR